MSPNLIAWLLSLVFCLAATAKYFSLKEFESTIEASKLLPKDVVIPVSLGILVTEFLTAGLLLSKLNRFGFQLAAALSSLFFGYNVWRWKEDIRAPCNCFGILFKLPTPASFLLTIAMTAISVFALVQMEGKSNEK